MDFTALLKPEVNALIQTSFGFLVAIALGWWNYRQTDKHQALIKDKDDEIKRLNEQITDLQEARIKDHVDHRKEMEDLMREIERTLDNTISFMRGLWNEGGRV